MHNGSAPDFDSGCRSSILLEPANKMKYYKNEESIVSPHDFLPRKRVCYYMTDGEYWWWRLNTHTKWYKMGWINLDLKKEKESGFQEITKKQLFIELL